jgi:O-antigen ligase
MLVLAAIVYLWLFDRPSRLLALLYAVNLLCLTLTLSRTAVIGTLTLLSITFVLSKRSRLFCLASAATTVALLFASTAFQSYDTYDRLRDRAATIAADLRQRFSSPESPAGSGGSAPAASRSSASASGLGAADDVRARVANNRSLEVRFEFIRRGQAVFRQHPLWGGGSAALVTPEMPLSSAHLSYLTLLARYGLAGALVYVTFLLVPLALVWLRPAPLSARLLVSIAILPLMVVYLSYDVLLFFEIQYLFFGVAYSTALNQPWVHDVPATAVV